MRSFSVDPTEQRLISVGPQTSTRKICACRFFKTNNAYVLQIIRGDGKSGIEHVGCFDRVPVPDADIVLTNPPFKSSKQAARSRKEDTSLPEEDVSVGNGDDDESGDLSDTENAKPSAKEVMKTVHFVEHGLKSVTRPGGLYLSVVPDGVICGPVRPFTSAANQIEPENDRVVTLETVTGIPDPNLCFPPRAGIKGVSPQNSAGLRPGGRAPAAKAHLQGCSGYQRALIIDSHPPRRSWDSVPLCLCRILWWWQTEP